MSLLASSGDRSLKSSAGLDGFVKKFFKNDFPDLNITCHIYD